MEAVEAVEVQCPHSTSTPPRPLYCRVRWPASTGVEEARWEVGLVAH